MGRRIIWYTYESGGNSNQSTDSYFDRLMKYIPSDVIGLWLAGSGIIQSQGEGIARTVALWGLLGIGIIFSWLWTRKQILESSQDESAKDLEASRPSPERQIWLSCCSFIIWVFAIGGPFAELPFYQPWISSLLLVIYTSAIPLLPAPPTGNKKIVQ